MSIGRREKLNTNQRDGVTYRKATIPTLILSQANNGTGMCFYLMMTYATYIGVQAYGLKSLAVGTILMFMRIFDGFTDALIAGIFEKMNPKLPKVRIFLLTGYGLAALGILLMYNFAAGKFTGIAGMVVFVTIYILYLLGYTINGIGGQVCGILITNDPKQRPFTGLISTLFSYVTPAIITNICTFWILPKFEDQYDVSMLSFYCIFMVVLAGVFVTICCIGMRKVDNEKNYQVTNEVVGTKKQTSVKWKDIVAVFSSNKNTQKYYLACISDKFAHTLASYSVIGTLMNGVLIGSYVAATWVGNFSTIISFLFTSIGAIYVARVGARRSEITCSWVAIALKTILLIFCVILGPVGMSRVGSWGPELVIYGLITMAFTATSMILSVAGNTMRADVVDYELDRSGNYFPAVVSGVYNFIGKLVDSVTAVVVTACISIVGYVHTVPQMGDKATWPILILTMAIFNGMPIIGYFINVFAMKNYTLTKEEMVEVAKRNEEKKNSIIPVN